MKVFEIHRRDIDGFTVEIGVDEIAAGGIIDLNVGHSHIRLTLTKEDRRWLLRHLKHEYDAVPPSYECNCGNSLCDVESLIVSDNDPLDLREPPRRKR